MPYYIDEWKPRPKWFTLTPEDRGKFLFDQSPTIQGLTEAGIELVGYMISDKGTGNGHHFSFLRIWKMPEKALAERIEEALEKAEWNEFFEAGDFRGEILTSQVAIPHLISL